MGLFPAAHDEDYQSPIVRFGIYLVGVISLVIAPLAAWTTVAGFLGPTEK